MYVFFSKSKKVINKMMGCVELKKRRSRVGARGARAKLDYL